MTRTPLAWSGLALAALGTLALTFGAGVGLTVAVLRAPTPEPSASQSDHPSAEATAQPSARPQAEPTAQQPSQTPNELLRDTARLAAQAPPPAAALRRAQSPALASADSGLPAAKTRVDIDNDGYFSTGGPAEPVDCNDRDPRIHPGALEAPAANGVDDNCDGRIDEGTTAWDDDGDGLSEDQGDCNDHAADIYPGAPERPDCRDQDCDGEIDEGLALPQRDDAFETLSRTGPADLETRSQRRFTRTLDLITRDDQDDELFAFYSQDGDWDDWRITATVTALPAHSAYRLELRRGPTVLSSALVHRDGDTVELTGRPFHDDSGTYQLAIVPLAVERPWCPITVKLEST